MSEKATAHKPPKDTDANQTEETALALIRAFAKLETEMQAFFSSYGITSQQFNILRILYVRDQGHGLPCHEIQERLLQPSPDLTRLLDRMEKAGLIGRHRCPGDRRVVRTVLTPEGRRLATEIRPAAIDWHQKRWSHLSEKELQQLQHLLDRTRER